MTDTLEKLFNTRDAAAAMHVSVKRLERHRTDGTGPTYIKLSPGRSGRVRYRSADVLLWLDARVRASTQNAAVTAGS